MQRRTALGKSDSFPFPFRASGPYIAPFVTAGWSLRPARPTA